MNEIDPFGEMQQAAKRQQAEEVAAKNMSVARSILVLDRTAKGAFFATLAMSLKLVPVWDIETAATNGKELRYNPDFVNGLNDHTRVGLFAHEVMHNANRHQTRQGNREAKRWNIAGDLAINSLLVDAGYVLPNEGCIPGKDKFRNLDKALSAEDYYSRLPDQPQSEDEGDDPGGCGGVIPAGDGSEAAAADNEAEWEVKVVQAGEAAARRGELPAGIQRLIGEIQQPKVDWRSVLREFVTVFARNDYSWNPMNRRYIHMGLYLPGMRSEELGDIVVAVDTSGSISQDILQLFAGEMQGILDAYQCKLKILYHDSAIAGEQTWESTDGPLVMEAAGGGGTDHRPVFDHIDAMPELPTCLVCLTDMCSCFPSEAPDYPVLWASTTPGASAPFGSLLYVEA